MNRRDFLLSSLSASSLFLLSPQELFAFESGINKIFPGDLSPMQKLASFAPSTVIEGDTHDEAHEIFWDKAGYVRKKGGIPAASKHYDVVIVGGGIAGLTAAYHLAGKKVLVIEGNPRVGGNSKSQFIGKSYMSQGGAYVVATEDGDEIDTFFSELKLKSRFRPTNHESEAMAMNGRMVKGFWDGATDPARSSSFKDARARIQKVWDEEYPELPVWGEEHRAGFNELDKISFAQWIARELPGIHPHVKENMQLYTWSSFGTTLNEISAAHGLNFYACDMNGTLVLPGGNGMIAQAAFEVLKRRGVDFRAPAFTVDVKDLGNKVQVCFKNESGALETVTGADCIVTAPKMVMKHVISDIPTNQLAAMNKLTYRAYLVANIFLNKKIKSPGYDIFAQTGVAPMNDYEDSKKRVFADIVFADWALKDSADKSVLTLYMPVPYAMAQQYLFVDDLHAKYEARVREKLKEFHTDLGITNGDILGMRLVRYGHAMPVGQVGGVASGLFERAHASMGQHIHFAGQDNWGNACFETSFITGRQAALKTL